MSLNLNTEHISPATDFTLKKKAFLSFLYTMNSTAIYENTATIQNC